MLMVKVLSSMLALYSCVIDTSVVQRLLPAEGTMVKALPDLKGHCAKHSAADHQERALYTNDDGSDG